MLSTAGKEEEFNDECHYIGVVSKKGELEQDLA